MSLSHSHRARNPRAIAIIAVIWALILLAWWALQLAPIVAALGMLALLPAVWDVLRDRRATFDLDVQGIGWSAGDQSARIARERIDRIRLDTRLDLSLRMTLWLTDGTRLRVPPDAVPPTRTLLAALDADGYDYRRHHFSFL